MGLLYTSSKDRTIKMWRAEDGALCRTMTGHAHWINSLFTSTVGAVCFKKKNYKNTNFGTIKTNRSNS